MDTQIVFNQLYLIWSAFNKQKTSLKLKLSYLYFLKRNVFVKRKNINNLFSLIVKTIDSIPKCSFGLQDDITLYSFGFIIILSDETQFL